MKIGDTIYHCPILKEEDGVTIYKKPKPYITRLNYLTIQPASGYTKTLIYGKDIDKQWVGIAQMRYFENVFHENDLLYIDGAKPSNNEDYYGENANAVITSVKLQNMAISLSITKRVDNND